MGPRPVSKFRMKCNYESFERQNFFSRGADDLIRFVLRGLTVVIGRRNVIIGFPFLVESDYVGDSSLEVN